MNCPKCELRDVHGILSQTDQLWCEFDSEIIDGYLQTVFYCRRCDWNNSKRFDPGLIHIGCLVEEE